MSFFAEIQTGVANFQDITELWIRRLATSLWSFISTDQLPFGMALWEFEQVKAELLWSLYLLATTFCCHHPAHHLGGVWTPPPTLHTHSTWARWSKPWLLTLVEYHWAHSGTGVLHNHLTGCIVGISTVNSTSCRGTTNKWLRHFRTGFAACWCAQM